MSYNQAGYQGPPQVNYQGGQYSKDHTTVIVTQPMAGGMGAPPPRDWSTGLFDMFADMKICLCATFLGSCLMCKVSQDMDETCCVPMCVPGALITMRTKWRTQENIQGTICDDCIMVQCCGLCVLCQLAREVDKKQKGTLYIQG